MQTAPAVEKLPPISLNIIFVLRLPSPISLYITRSLILSLASPTSLHFILLLQPNCLTSLSFIISFFDLSFQNTVNPWFLLHGVFSKSRHLLSFPFLPHPFSPSHPHSHLRSRGARCRWEDGKRESRKMRWQLIALTLGWDQNSKFDCTNTWLGSEFQIWLH